MAIIVLAGVKYLDVSQKLVFALVVPVACTDEWTAFVSARMILVALQVFLGCEGLWACSARIAFRGCDTPTSRHWVLVDSYFSDWIIVRDVAITLRT